MSSKPAPEISLYPEVILTNPEATSPLPSKTTTTTSSSLYPAIDMTEVASNLFPDDGAVSTHPSEEVLVTIPGAVLHLIENDNSVELACGDFSVVGLRQDANIVAVLARIGDEIQWPLAKDEATVKLVESHYFFTLRVPSTEEFATESDDGEILSASAKQFEVLNYGLTIASKGQEGLLKELDRILETYSCFSTEKVTGGEVMVLDGAVARETTPEEMRSESEKMEMMKESSAAFWTTLAPNVEEYGGRVAKMIAAGSGQLIRGILWCGDVTVDRLKWGDEFLAKRLAATSTATVCPRTLRRIRRFVHFLLQCFGCTKRFLLYFVLSLLYLYSAFVLGFRE